MKKTLLLSVVASTMIMAGGDIAPVEPVVVVEEVSAWEFGGDLVAYTQTIDNPTLLGSNDLFGGDTTSGLVGLSLRAANQDVFAGIGFGAEVSAIGRGDHNGYSNSNFGLQYGNALTQGYLTYGIDAIDTSIKVGRQHLPKSLSPFAFTEGWQAIKNSFDAALVVNSSLPDTALVYAYVTKANRSVADINAFNDINDDGVHMLTAQNKSIDGLTLTGTWYIAPDMTSGLIGGGDVNVLWGDAAYAGEHFGAAIQGGQVTPDGLDDTTAFGAKVTGNLGMFDLLAAYSSVSDGAVPIHNLGTGVKTPLYTQSILDQNTIKMDSDAIKLAAGMKALGGKFGLAYNYSELGATALAPVTGASGAGAGEYSELDLTYKTKVFNDSTTLFAGYVYQDDDRMDGFTISDDEGNVVSTFDGTQNMIRVWGRYNF